MKKYGATGAFLYNFAKRLHYCQIYDLSSQTVCVISYQYVPAALGFVTSYLQQ